MGRFYCDYCHCYLTYSPSKQSHLTSRHDSASVRKNHNLGRNHLQLVREYYEKIGYDKAQSVIDAINQDYQSRTVDASNPFAASAGMFMYPPNANRNLAGGRTFAGMTFGGPVSGMPLPPPPGMPLPGGQNALAPNPVGFPPFGFPPPAGVVGPPVVPPATGGRVG